MISIIVAVYNQFPMNKLFMESIRRYSTLTHELIVVDNGSTDGSAEFFEQSGATVIRNGRNFSYPYCQNQGVNAARFPLLAFLNNDIIVSQGWDHRAVEIMNRRSLDIVSWTSTDRCESAEATLQMGRRWKKIRNPLLFLFGPGSSNLRLMHRLMYGPWEQFTEERYRTFGDGIREGFTGCALLMKRDVIDRIGGWDETIQAADFDLFLRVKERSHAVGDIKPIQLLLGVYVHHFIRLTVKSKVPRFADVDRLRGLEDKWGKDRVNELLMDTDVRI